MHLAASSSWRFVQSDAAALRVALYGRDALRLPVGEGPPRLEGGVPDRRDVLAAAQVTSVAQQWPAWWQSVAGLEVALHQGLDDVERERVLAALRTLVGPHINGTDRPQLQEAVRLLEREAVHGRQPPADEYRSRPTGDLFPRGLVREVAEDVAFDRQVDLARVRGVALVLPLQGAWWHLQAPGAVLCSQAAARDPGAAAALLRGLFSSSLTR